MLIVFWLLIVLIGYSYIFSIVNFFGFIFKGRVLTHRKIWLIIQVFAVVVLPILFLATFDFNYQNNCCGDSAVFSPPHRISIYTLIFICMVFSVIGIFRRRILPPILETLLNSFIILGLILNVLFCFHFNTSDQLPLWIFGNPLIIIVLLILLMENHKLLMINHKNNQITAQSRIGKICIKLLTSNIFLKYMGLTVLLIPILILINVLLMLFGQKPDSAIKAFTDTYKHGFSQLDYMCDNVNCGGHFLCSVGANGHKKIVKPIRYGERNGNMIICNRQLLISNAFEDIIQQYCPIIHRIIRRSYNRIGNLIHKYYYVFKIKWISDVVYLLMKPLEICFLIIIYTVDRKPENRIATQYLKSNDRKVINQS